MSQTKLGDAVGLTFQQIQKYERGANRIGASRLFEFSKILDVPISYFFEDMPAEIFESAGIHRSDGPKFDTAVLNPMIEPEAVALVRIYERIADASVRKSLFNLAKTLSQSGEN